MSWAPRVVLVLALLGAPAARADIPPAYRNIATALDVPPPVLYAVALTESGRPFPSGRTLPWPWSLNIAGREQYFPSREAAHTALVATLARGEHNVDVGLMQINWYWNGERLLDAWSALDPTVNLTLGAILLREHYEALKDWWPAIGRYHSRRARHATRYRARVARWLRTLDEDAPS